MRVIQADVLGMCFGVRDALEVAHAIESPHRVTIHGELVHNPLVLSELSIRGFLNASEKNRDPMPDTPDVLITAHGISEMERNRLHSAGKRLIDTTCPLVHKVHLIAQRLQRDGYHILVIGKPGHVEVQGLVGDLSSYDIVGSVEDVRRFEQNRLAIVCQTTALPALVITVRDEIERQNPHAEIRFADTVCQPTKDHQNALERLLPLVDAVVVVGGRNSNNTRALVERCREEGVPAFHVESASDIEPAWFEECTVLGLTAGTSTLDTTIAEVRTALEHLPTRSRRELFV